MRYKPSYALGAHLTLYLSRKWGVLTGIGCQSGTFHHIVRVPDVNGGTAGTFNMGHHFFQVYMPIDLLYHIQGRKIQTDLFAGLSLNSTELTGYRSSSSTLAGSSIVYSADSSLGRKAKALGIHAGVRLQPRRGKWQRVSIGLSLNIPAANSIVVRSSFAPTGGLTTGFSTHYRPAFALLTAGYRLFETRIKLLPSGPCPANGGTY